MKDRTDLAIEQIYRSESQNNTYIKDGIKITDIVVDEITSEKIGKDKGRYITIEFTSALIDPNNGKKVSKIISDTLSEIIPDGDCLIAGLGNYDITPDALGPMTANRIFVTRHLPDFTLAETGLDGIRKVSSVAVGVLGQTGIESEETVKSTAELTGCKCVIVIDALSAQKAERIGTTIQITYTGISPGSGVRNNRKKICKSSLGGIDVIAIGMPTVIDAETIVRESDGNESKIKNMVVTPKDIDRIISSASEIISAGINMALFPEIDPDELDLLVQ